MQELATFCDKLCIKKVPYYTGGKDMRSVSDISNEFKKLHNNKNIFSKFRSNYLKNDHLLNWILFLLIVYGLYLKLQSSFSIPLNSDSVLPGLFCREIFVHGNYLLKGYYFPFPDPHIFSELIPFHVLPQLLTRYDPKALYLTSYSIYVAVIIIYSALIYNIKRRITNSLIFASVLANIPNNADIFFLVPTTQMGTIFFYRNPIVNIQTKYKWEIKRCLLFTCFSSYKFLRFSPHLVVFHSILCSSYIT